MQEVTQYSKIWRYDYNQSKSGVMVFGESRVQHYREKQTRHWELDGNVVTELDEYKNLLIGVVKNYTSSSRLDISEAIEKTQKKARMLLNGCTDRRKTNPTIYINPPMARGGGWMAPSQQVFPIFLRNERSFFCKLNFCL